MIERQTLERAAFWDGVVCLDCEAVLPAPEEPLEDLSCPTCGNGLYTCAFILKVLDTCGGEGE